MKEVLLLPAELLRSFQNGDTVVFLGADFSAAAGLPEWVDLVRPLAQAIGSRWPMNDQDITTDRFLNTIQYYENQRGRNALISYLRKALDSSGKPLALIHQLVASLPVDTVFTTTYDDFIEEAFRQIRRDYNVVVDEAELAFWQKDKAQIVKLCGDLRQPKSIMISHRDFSTYSSTHPRLVERLRSTLESVSALFLGYSLRDPFFNQIWDSIGLDFGALRRRGYAVLLDESPLHIDDLQHRGIQAINLETNGHDKQTVLERWLTSLINAIPFHHPLAENGKEEKQLESEPTFGTSNRWAVLVGINEYEDHNNYGQLQVCTKDVKALQEQLVIGGFDSSHIRLLTDKATAPPTRENILVALKSIADATEPDDLLLFYYSGHGDEDSGESYLVARNSRRLVLPDSAVPISRVKEIVEQAPARGKIIILDACHSGADIGGKGPKRMSTEFIRRVFEEAEGLAILASCKQGQLSYEWRAQERSVFTHFLLEALAGKSDPDEKGFVTIQDVNRYVVDKVKLWASQNNTSQTPTLQYTVSGDIVLCKYTFSD
jgi:hypothetical protein